MKNFVASCFALGFAINPAWAEKISYGEITNFRNLSMLVRFADCSDEKCERHIPDTSITPDRFMEADTIDFNGYPLLSLPGWLFEMDNLKTLRLTNSELQLDDFKRLSELEELQILELDNIKVTGTPSETEIEIDADEFVILSDILRPLSNLTHLNISEFKLNGRCIDVSSHFISSSTASNLMSLNIFCSQTRGRELIYIPFPNLETIIAHGAVEFSSSYRDAFSLPSLTYIGGFRGENSLFVRDRVFARREALSISLPGETMEFPLVGVTVIESNANLCNLLGPNCIQGLRIIDADEDSRLLQYIDGTIVRARDNYNVSGTQIVSIGHLQQFFVGLEQSGKNAFYLDIFDALTGRVQEKRGSFAFTPATGK